ncbi:UBX domain-containing protein 4 [Haplosporangium sp. Z 767]|nr:UBX domain-containing protein 4 [Haplosporangium sp. Z 767]
MTLDDATTAPVSASIWYEGSVANAVASANANGSVLLVCLIQDATDGSESSQFACRFTDTKVASELSGMNLVALKLIKDSTDGAMFGQIFPIMVVPALYVIRNGLLADFMNSTVDIDQMLERIKKAVDGHFQIPPPPNAALSPSASATSTPPVAPTSADNASLVARSPQATTLVAENQTASGASAPNANLTSATNATPDAIGTATEAGSSSIPTTSNAPSRTDQSQVLKDLMKERKQKREKEEREAAKQRELDRRTSSKVLSEAQRELAEKQSKKLKDQIEREKREEAEYKKRVKQALEEDKARRKAEREKALAAAAGNSPPQEQVLTPAEIRAQNSGLTQARNDAAPALAFDTSRLNIRLFDGSSIRRTFNATDTLQQVRDWINENQDEENSAYNIVQLIPPRTFTDESKMLRDLELCPSATLVLKKIATASSAYGGSGDGAVPTLMGYGWSALGLAGKLASTAYSTVSYYNPLASTSSGGSSSNNSNVDHTSRSASSKKKDRETSYNGNSTSLE